MKIQDFEILDRCLFWRKEKILVVGDLHLGFEEVLREQGWNIPKNQIRETLENMEKIFRKTKKCREIILLGDVKHYFAGILAGEWKDFYELMKLLKKNLLKNGKIIIIKGNHDSILEPLIYTPQKSEKNHAEIGIYDFYIKNSYLFIHGDYRGLKKIRKIKKQHKQNFSLIICGHYHPALVLKDKYGIKSERYKCFLYGKSKEFNTYIVILPSFFPLIEGTDIFSHNSMLEGWIDVKNFSVYAIDDSGNVYDFGKIKDIR